MDSLTEELIDLTSSLVARASVSPDDAGCQEIIGRALAGQGFAVTTLPFAGVSNLWAVHGQGAPMVVLAGHTDVVPSGPADTWRHPPFQPTLEGGLLYGRGSADMKGSLAAMLTATAAFIAACPDHAGTIAYLITSDEEADALDGTVRVVEWLEGRNIRPEYCIVGEPSSRQAVGDVIRIGRRGSVNGRLRVRGIQGHVAYPEQARNPVHQSLAALDALVRTRWDQGNRDFPPTSLQISNMHAGTGASNVIPGTLDVAFNLRFSTEQTSAGLREQVTALLDGHGLDYELDWSLSGEPFLTAGEFLLDAVQASIREVRGSEAEPSTGGGTSDGRFIARLGTQIVELGPVNATIHSVNEHVAVEELTALCRMYQGILRRLLVEDHG